jgi:hypothetical protein
VASIGYSSDGEAVTLSYALDGASMQQRVTILRTACNFGGARAWFACPRCRRRVVKTYLAGCVFGCRVCYGLAYTSQSEDAIGRSWRAQAKLEARLGEDGERPKGMHWRTYKRLPERIEDREATSDKGLAALLARMGLVR